MWHEHKIAHDNNEHPPDCQFRLQNTQRFAVVKNTRGEKRSHGETTLGDACKMRGNRPWGLYAIVVQYLHAYSKAVHNTWIRRRKRKMTMQSVTPLANGESLLMKTQHIETGGYETPSLLDTDTFLP